MGEIRKKKNNIRKFKEREKKDKGIISYLNIGNKENRRREGEKRNIRKRKEMKRRGRVGEKKMKRREGEKRRGLEKEKEK